jgi:hypothetical protein
MTDNRLKPDPRREPSMLAVTLSKAIPDGTAMPVVLKAIEMMLVETAIHAFPDDVENQTRALMLSFGSAVNAVKLAAAIKPQVEQLHKDCKAEGREPTREEVIEVMSKVRDSVLGKTPNEPVMVQ